MSCVHAERSIKWLVQASPWIPATWVRLHDGDSVQSYFWNRRSREGTWRARLGVQVVWVWEMSAGKVLLQLAPWITRVSARIAASLHYLLGDGPRGEGRGMPLTPSWVPLLLPFEATVVLASAVFFLV